jgi:hypothetical protein
MAAQARTDHVRTLRDILSALKKGLSRLPASADVHSAQRALKVLDTQLEKLEAQ